MPNHKTAPNAAATDWAQIAGLYDVLVHVEPSPVVELNRAVAVAMRDGPDPYTFTLTISAEAEYVRIIPYLPFSARVV